MHELAFGVAGSRHPEKSAQALAVLLSSADITVLAFDEAAAAQAGRLRAALRARGEPIGPFDTLIAGHALSEGATLVTANVGEFARCDGLSVVDWSA
jgi:tRNA(fMet)-specific endonuclease VapC